MPTKSTDLNSENAKRNFTLGERSLRAYFAGGNVRFLEDAEFALSKLNSNDKQFYNASRFYLGVAKTQLRKTDESIRIFENLRDASTNGQVDRGQVALQLAYAHTKTYTDSGYQAALAELTRVFTDAEAAQNIDLKLQAASLLAFLYSVMAGRSGNTQNRPDYAREAIAFAESILSSVAKTAESARTLRFEALNALGIVWMRIGENQWPGFPDQRESWAKSEAYYDLALREVPNSLRTMQNMARKRLMQVARSFSKEERLLLLDEAQRLCLRSLEVSDQDQYPYLLLAEIAAAAGNRQDALRYIATGQTRPGAVKPDEWEQIKRKAEALPKEST
jgi:tetratricopeptide (TPR) repeat protein